MPNDSIKVYWNPVWMERITHPFTENHCKQKLLFFNKDITFVEKCQNSLWLGFYC